MQPASFTMSRARFRALIENRRLRYGSPFMSEPEPHVRMPERRKRAGLRYAWSADGVELPVIDVTQPSFAELPNDDALRVLTEAYEREQRRWERLPTFVRRALYRLVLGNSLLGTGMRAAEGGFLGGM